MEYSIMIYFFLALIQFAFANTYSDQKALTEKITVKEHMGENISTNLEFVHHSGQNIKLSDLMNKDRPILFTLNYYSCATLCSVQLNALKGVLTALDWKIGENFEIVTISIDSEETAELASDKRQNYLTDLFLTKENIGNKEDLSEEQNKELQNILESNNWHFMVGQKEDIQKIADEVGYGFAYDPVSKDYLHPAVVMVLSPEGMISRYLYGISFDAKDLKFSLIDAANGKVGSPMEQLIMSCYSFDLSTGKYTPVAFKVMRLAGIITVFSIGLLVFGLRQQERVRMARLKEGKTEV